jgi:hypothetical protein
MTAGDHLLRDLINLIASNLCFMNCIFLEFLDCSGPQIEAYEVIFRSSNSDLDDCQEQCNYLLLQHEIFSSGTIFATLPTVEIAVHFSSIER